MTLVNEYLGKTSAVRRSERVSEERRRRCRVRFEVVSSIAVPISCQQGVLSCILQYLNFQACSKQKERKPKCCIQAASSIKPVFSVYLRDPWSSNLLPILQSCLVASTLPSLPFKHYRPQYAIVFTTWPLQLLHFPTPIASTNLRHSPTPV
jgi:hypothetical protein